MAERQPESRSCAGLSPSAEAQRVAAEYLRAASGDPRGALLLAIEDGLKVCASVSRGYVRWGQPARRRL